MKNVLTIGNAEIYSTYVIMKLLLSLAILELIKQK